MIVTLSKLVRKLRSRGGRFVCNVCDRRVQVFVALPDYYLEHMRSAGYPYGLDQAETCHAASYSCPHCGAADRDRLIALYLADWFVALAGPATIIDFAPSAPLSAFIRRRIATGPYVVSYRTADLHASGVDDVVDITAMPTYATGSVDLFLCSHVLEHVADDRAAMRELCRILKPGGQGLLLVPIVVGVDAIDEDPAVTDPAERWRRFGQDDHVRLYSKAGFVGRLREAGFAVRELGVGHFGAKRLAEQGVAARSVLYVSDKPTG